MAGHKKQHFIPRSYLKAWCDPNTLEGQEPYVWVFSRVGSNARRKAPESLFHETDLYTIELPGGGRNLILEHGLSQLESEFASIRDARLRAQAPLEPGEHAWLCAFIAATHERTPAQRDHLQQQWGKVVALSERMMEWAKTATPAQKQAASSLRTPNRERGLTYDDVKRLAEKPLQIAMMTSIETQIPLLMHLDLAVLTCSENTPGFITSDNPCVWFDAKACKRPPLFQSPALMYESIEITLPVSPRQIVLLNRRGLNAYLPAGESLVDQLNRRTRFSCVNHFVNNTNAIRLIWFDPGVEPEDSWRNQHPETPE